MRIENLGHSCFLIEVKGFKILLDPFLNENPIAKIKASDVECDLILVTHGHGDHVADAEEIAKKNNCPVVANYEVGNWLTSLGVENVTGMNHGGNYAFDHGTIKMVNAVHSSSLPDGSYGGNPAGFIIKTPALNVYFAGDTALMADMKIFGEYENIGLSILPIGDVFTMGVDDAIIAAQMLKCKRVIGMH
ncbi:MAG: L-ascorbate metabolism protein UlaG (beta-lactamase superfamily), partial [Granulosicoccus sp.]